MDGLSLLLAALLVAAAIPEREPAAAETAEEILVKGKRMAGLKRLRLVTRTDRTTGHTECVFRRRSGDPELDAKVCVITLGCAAKAETQAAMQACMAPAMDALIRGVE